MLFNHQSQLLRVALLSKGLVGQSHELPVIQQVSVAVKAENRYDIINNVSLLVALTGVHPLSMIVNRKQATVLPQIVLSQLDLPFVFSQWFTMVTKRLADKTVSNNYRAGSNKLSFTFKSTDALTPELHKLWKWLGSEVGLFSVQAAFVTNSHQDMLNEAILRGYGLPVAINK